MPESGIPRSDRATRRYTKLHLDFYLPFSTYIGQVGRVPLFGAGPRRYIRSRRFRLAANVFRHALTASWRQKGKRKQVFPRAIRTTELPLKSSPLSTGDGAQLTFRNNQIQISQTSSTLGTTQPWQPTSLSKLPTHTQVDVIRTHAHTTRDKGINALTVPRRPPVRPNTHTRSRGWRHPS